MSLAAGCQLWGHSVVKSFGGSGGSLLTTRPAGPPSVPCPSIAPTMPAAPVHGDLFQPKVTTCCPQNPSSSPKYSSYQAQDMLVAAKSPPAAVTCLVPTAGHVLGHPPVSALHVTSHFLFLSPGQSYHVHPECPRTGLRLPGTCSRAVPCDGVADAGAAGQGAVLLVAEPSMPGLGVTGTWDPRGSGGPSLGQAVSGWRHCLAHSHAEHASSRGLGHQHQAHGELENTFPTPSTGDFSAWHRIRLL